MAQQNLLKQLCCYAMPTFSVHCHYSKLIKARANSCSGMAVARDIKGKRDRIVTVINNGTTMTGQVYEAMSNAGYLDSDMVVILNDSRHSLNLKLEETPETSINALSSTLSKLQSSKLFRRLRQFAKVFLCCLNILFYISTFII